MKIPVVFIIRPGATATHPAWLAERFKQQGAKVTAVTNHPPMIHAIVSIPRLYDVIAGHRYWIVGVEEDKTKERKPSFVSQWRYADAEAGDRDF